MKKKKSRGRKLDKSKPMWGLLPFEPLQEIVKVLTFGAKKYSKDNWQYVPDAKERYFNALFRHLTAWKMGEKTDPETSISHLAHCGCCILFLLWFELKGKKK